MATLRVRTDPPHVLRKKDDVADIHECGLLIISFLDFLLRHSNGGYSFMYTYVSDCRQKNRYDWSVNRQTVS